LGLLHGQRRECGSPGKIQPVRKTVNINKATEEELVKSVPLISPELAKKIVKYRKDNGNFQTLEELLQVDGFDRNLLRRIVFLLLEGIEEKTAPKQYRTYRKAGRITDVFCRGYRR
jgi:competence ComEA-like helix-hairpin-helix protein